MPGTKARTAGFTLIELLAALAFMAVVIPAIMQGMKIASLAGVVSQRKALAVRIGERVLNESIITGQYQSVQSGIERSGPYEFRWNIHDDPWKSATTSSSLSTANGVNQTAVNANSIHELSVDVVFAAQGKDYTVHLSTLVNPSQRATANLPPAMNTF